jgi:hypothetical protein
VFYCFVVDFLCADWSATSFDLAWDCRNTPASSKIRSSLTENFFLYNKDAVFQWCLLDSKSNWHNYHIFSSFYFIFSQSKNWITNQLHVFNPTKLQRELPFNLKKGGGACHFFLYNFPILKLGRTSNYSKVINFFSYLAGLETKITFHAC